MAKLAFYGGGDDQDNRLMDMELLKILGKKNLVFSFIPANSLHGEIEFQEFIHQYSRFGINNFFYCPIDGPTDELKISRVFKSDLIHLGGGNTFYFMQCLRKKRLRTKLLDFLKKGGVITGLSAGAIVLTPSISTASYPKFDCDDNFLNLKNFKGLNFVDFDFFPHFQNSERYRNALMIESKKIKRPLYAAANGSGIIVDEKKVTFIGKTWMFLNGKSYRFF